MLGRAGAERGGRGELLVQAYEAAGEEGRTHARELPRPDVHSLEGIPDQANSETLVGGANRLDRAEERSRNHCSLTPTPGRDTSDCQSSFASDTNGLAKKTVRFPFRRAIQRDT